MDGDAWTFKVMTCNPLPFTNENLKCLCQEVNEIYVEQGFSACWLRLDLISTSKHSSTTTFTIQNLSLSEVVGAASDPSRVGAEEEKKEEEVEKKE